MPSTYQCLPSQAIARGCMPWPTWGHTGLGQEPAVLERQDQQVRPGFLQPGESKDLGEVRA